MKMTKEDIINQLDRRTKELKDYLENDDYSFHAHPYFETEGMYKSLEDFRKWIKGNEDG